MPEIINTRLMAHPLNWVIVWVVIAIAAFGWHQVQVGISSAAQSSTIPD